MKSLIAAMDLKGGIGKDGKIPWYFKEDFAWFKEKTKGASLIMGYKTYVEIAEKFNYPESKKLLPGRMSYVISSKEIPESDLVKGFHNIEAAIDHSEKNHPNRDIFFIGGSRIFEAAIPLVDKAFITQVWGDYECDVFFPYEELNKKFKNPITSDTTINTEQKAIPLSFIQYVK